MRIQRSMLALTATAALALSAGCAAPNSGGGGGTDTGDSKAQGATKLIPARDYTTVDPALEAAAKKEGGALLWYDSSPSDQAKKVMADFKKDYPFVKDTKHVVLRAGDIGARVAQESQANADTADVVTADAATLGQLNDRDLLSKVDWDSNGVPEEVAPNKTMTVSGASIFAFLYNTDKVTKKEAPATWDDMVDKKWSGKVGTWDKPYAFAELVPALGGKKATEYHDAYNALDPKKYESTFPLAQAVGAGEIDAGIGLHHSAQPAIASGSPIEVVVPDPAPVTLLYSSVPKSGANTKTGELFASWLTAKNGATSYDKATQRGNVLLPDTDASALVKGRDVSDFAADDAAKLTDWLDKFAR